MAFSRWSNSQIYHESRPLHYRYQARTQDFERGVRQYAPPATGCTRASPRKCALLLPQHCVSTFHRLHPISGRKGGSTEPPNPPCLRAGLLGHHVYAPLRTYSAWRLAYVRAHIKRASSQLALPQLHSIALKTVLALPFCVAATQTAKTRVFSHVRTNSATREMHLQCSLIFNFDPL